MPWCDPCGKYYTPNTLTTEGACPECGEDLSDHSDLTQAKVPWHFWLLLGAAVIYLGWRLIQGIDWVINAV